MTSPNPGPLWKEVLGDTEPWRRGRVFLVIVGCVTLLLQGLLVANAIILGFIDFALFQGIVALGFWLLFYFIWIGIHWIRWLVGAWNALYGFVLLIWGIRDGNALGVIVGLYSLVIGCYMAFAPSVYFFAKRQRETVRRVESIAIAFGFLVLGGTLTAGFLALRGYRASLERDAGEFADRAFRRIFTQHDTAFLLEHASDRLIKAAGDRSRLSGFLQHEFLNAGDVHNIAPPKGSLRFWYSFPLRLSSEGQMSSTGVGEKWGVQMQIIIGDDSGDWQIHGIGWQPDYSIKPPTR